MSELDAVVTALAARIRTGLGSDALAGRVFAFGPGTLNPPTAIVLPAPGDFIVYGATFDDANDYNLIIKVIMSAADDRSGQAQLLGYLHSSGTTSIVAAIDADQTLGGTCSSATPTVASSWGDVEWGGQVYYGAEIAVEILA